MSLIDPSLMLQGSYIRLYIRVHFKCFACNQNFMKNLRNRFVHIVQCHSKINNMFERHTRCPTWTVLMSDMFFNRNKPLQPYDDFLKFSLRMIFLIIPACFMCYRYPVTLDCFILDPMSFARFVDSQGIN